MNRTPVVALALFVFACAGSMSAQKRPSILLEGDDCENGVATQAAVVSFKDAVQSSQRWTEGNEKVPKTPEILIQCWNVHGESIVVTSFGFTVSGGKALFDKPKLWLALTPESGRQLGTTIFNEWEKFWREDPVKE